MDTRALIEKTKFDAYMMLLELKQRETKSEGK